MALYDLPHLSRSPSIQSWLEALDLLGLDADSRPLSHALKAFVEDIHHKAKSLTEIPPPTPSQVREWPQQLLERYAHVLWPADDPGALSYSESTPRIPRKRELSFVKDKAR